MRPFSRAPRPQPHDGVFGHAKARRQILKHTVITTCRADDCNRFIAQHGFVTALAALIWHPTMRDFVSGILDRRRPAHIRRKIVRWVAITMGGLVLRGGWWSLEGRANKAMHKSGRALPIHPQTYLQIPTSRARDQTQDAPGAFPLPVRNNPLHAPHARHSIVGRFGNRAPFFRGFHAKGNDRKPPILQASGGWK